MTSVFIPSLMILTCDFGYCSGFSFSSCSFSQKFTILWIYFYLYFYLHLLLKTISFPTVNCFCHKQHLSFLPAFKSVAWTNSLPSDVIENLFLWKTRLHSGVCVLPSQVGIGAGIVPPSSYTGPDENPQLFKPLLLYNILSSQSLRINTTSQLVKSGPFSGGADYHKKILRFSLQLSDY